MRYFVFLSFLGFIQCKTAQLNRVDVSKTQTIILCDSIQSATLIVTDYTDRFFEKINDLDISIQMNQRFEEGTSHRTILNSYLTFLQKDVGNFSKAETIFVQDCLKEVVSTCKVLNINILPSDLFLIKSKAKQYGEGTWYTRENCIVVPYDALDKRNRAEFIGTLYHEIFHCYSRANPEKRVELYALIGFKATTKPLNMPTPLKNRILLNPDGVNYATKIDLVQSPDRTIAAFPILYSTEYQLVAKKNKFFDYMGFALYEAIDEPPHIDVMTKSDGFSSTIDLKEQPDFMRQIGDNTGYIIHPDEVLADNFMFVCNSIKEPKSLDKFSAEGKILIKKVRDIVVRNGL